MEQASLRLADTEESASEHLRKALRDPSSAHESKIYPRGAQYALVHAEAQLMSAVVGVLNESLTESLRGFYKLRKAFAALQEIVDAEDKYLAKHFSSSTTSLATSSTLSTSTNSGVVTPADTEKDEFTDAAENIRDSTTPINYQGKVDLPDADKPNPQITLQSKPDAVTDPKNAVFDFTTVTNEPIDLFIHSGAATCFGLLQLLISMIPPAFGKVLSIFSFRGDREAGLRLLWKATAFKHNINGAMAGLVLLPFHNAAIGLCDIHRREAYPKERIRGLLQEMRTIYPGSLLWILEEARMYGTDRDLEMTVDVLNQSAKPSTLKQVDALRVFETSMACMFLHRYEDCAKSFINCITLNNWSHALYYYIAGCCHVELYRINQHTDPKVAEKHKAQATKYLQEVNSHSGKRRFMARQLPLDVFITRKIAKWQHRAKAHNGDMIDGIGVSPLEEMIYMWSGFKRMRQEHLETSLERLAWSESQPSYSSEPADEKAILHLLKATCYRNMNRIPDAQAELAEKVFVHDNAAIRACYHADNWSLPIAHYEKAVCIWQAAGGQDGDRGELKACSDELAKVENWGSFELDARFGLKLTTARQTLTACGVV